MPRLLKKLFIPHHSNNYHPHSIRHHSLLSYALILLIANYLVFPLFGLNSSTVKAANISSTEIIELANKDRNINKIGLLTENQLLSQAAKAKAKDMFAKQYWSHFGPNNETPWQFIKSAGYDYIYAGENLAKNFDSGIDAHAAWMNSTSHRENILNSKFEEIGIGFEEGVFQGEQTVIIVEMFGTRNKETEAVNKTALTNQAVAPKPTAQQTKETKTNITPSPNVSPTPEILNQAELSPPEILEPKNDSEFTSNNVTIKGNSQSGNLLRVFSNNKLIGELPKEEAAFNIDVSLLDNNNIIYLIAKDSATGQESKESNFVNVKVNKIPEVKAATSIDNVPRKGLSEMLAQKTKTTGQKFNFLFALGIFLMVVFDSIYVLRHGIKRDSGSNHSFNLAILVVFLLGIFFI